MHISVNVLLLSMNVVNNDELYVSVLSVGDQGYYEGRTDGGREGWFPGTNVKDITLRRGMIQYVFE